MRTTCLSVHMKNDGEGNKKGNVSTITLGNKSPTNSAMHECSKFTMRGELSSARRRCGHSTEGDAASLSGVAEEEGKHPPARGQGGQELGRHVELDLCMRDVQGHDTFLNFTAISK